MGPGGAHDGEADPPRGPALAHGGIITNRSAKDESFFAPPGT
jgi:hypothetical protein